MILKEGISPLMIRQKIQADMLLPGPMTFGFLIVGDSFDPSKFRGRVYPNTILCEYLHLYVLFIKLLSHPWLSAPSRLSRLGLFKLFESTIPASLAAKM